MPEHRARRIEHGFDPTGAAVPRRWTLGLSAARAAGGGARARGARRRPRPARAASAPACPPVSSRSTGSASGESILRPAGARRRRRCGAGAAPATRSPLASATARGRLRRRPPPVARGAARRPPVQARARALGKHVALEVLDELAEELRRHVGDHAPTELRDLAGDREVGVDVDPGAVAVGRSASAVIVADALPWPRVSRPSARITARRAASSTSVETRPRPCTAR